ncbi:MAG: response regulator [bacterium]
MLGKSEPQTNPLKEKVAKHLRTADGLTKQGNYEQAIVEIDNALKLDPKNYYARSFLERVRTQMQRIKDQAVKQLRTEAMDEEKRDAIISEALRTAEFFIDSREYPKALQEIAKVYAIDPTNYFARSYSDRIEVLMEQGGPSESATAYANAVPPPQEATTMPEPVPEAPVGREIGRASLTLYQEMLKEMLFDGKINQDESMELQKVRDLFGITQEQHEEMIKQVKIDAYVEALRIAWRDGNISKNEAQVLQMMRQKYNISMEEHMSAEARILWARNTAATKATILIVEDEVSILLTLAAQLKKHGYEVKTAETVEQALEVIAQSPPSLILSDLLFPEGSLNGLEFYQRVREHTNLQDIPFLLMSGVSDQFVVRAGMRMGVDSFLQKPFDLELLLATIEGRLK